MALSVTTVSAGLFGFGTIECEQFSIDIPSGFSITDGWDINDKHVDNVYLGTDIPNKGETHRYLEMWEVSSFDNLTDDGCSWELY